jgi:hypothetical protein
VLLPSLVVVPLDSAEMILGAIAAMMWASRCEREAEVDGRVEVFRMGIGVDNQRYLVSTCSANATVETAYICQSV